MENDFFFFKEKGNKGSKWFGAPMQPRRVKNRGGKYLSLGFRAMNEQAGRTDL